MTFKEQLSLRADGYEVKTEIQKYIDLIKTRLEEDYSYRIFTISLIKPHDTMAIGRRYGNYFETFIPHSIVPNHYRQLFITELEKLGFTEEDMELVVEESNLYDAYKIILRW